MPPKKRQPKPPKESSKYDSRSPMTKKEYEEQGLSIPKRPLRVAPPKPEPEMKVRFPTLEDFKKVPFTGDRVPRGLSPVRKPRGRPPLKPVREKSTVEEELAGPSVAAPTSYTEVYVKPRIEKPNEKRKTSTPEPSPIYTETITPAPLSNTEVYVRPRTTKKTHSNYLPTQTTTLEPSPQFKQPTAPFLTLSNSMEFGNMDPEGDLGTYFGQFDEVGMRRPTFIPPPTPSDISYGRFVPPLSNSRSGFDKSITLDLLPRPSLRINSHVDDAVRDMYSSRNDYLVDPLKYPSMDLPNSMEFDSRTFSIDSIPEDPFNRTNPFNSPSRSNSTNSISSQGSFGNGRWFEPILNFVEPEEYVPMSSFTAKTPGSRISFGSSPGKFGDAPVRYTPKPGGANNMQMFLPTGATEGDRPPTSTNSKEFDRPPPPDNSFKLPEEPEKLSSYEQNKRLAATIRGTADVAQGAFGLVSNTVGILQTLDDRIDINKADRLQSYRSGIIPANTMMTTGPNGRGLQPATRDGLVKMGEMNVAYSTANIEAGIMKGEFPPGWTRETAINQGFGPVVNRYLMKEGEAQKIKEQKEQNDLKNHLFLADQRVKELTIDQNNNELIDTINNYQAY